MWGVRYVYVKEETQKNTQCLQCIHMYIHMPHTWNVHTYIQNAYILLMKWQCKCLQEKSHSLEYILLHIRDPYIYFKMTPKKNWSTYVEMCNMHTCMIWLEMSREKNVQDSKKEVDDSKKDVGDSKKDVLLERRQQSGRRDLALRAACRWLTCHSCRKACPLVFTCLYISVHIYIYILIQQS